VAEESSLMQLELCWVGLYWDQLKPKREFDVHFINRGDTDLKRQIEQMFQMDFNETHATSATEMSVEDRKALSIMENSAKLVDGHYQIALPW
jgi:aromatic ring-cleaving dioxygenase